MVHKMHIETTAFNFNLYSDSECLTIFCFRPIEFLKHRRLVGWNSDRTKGNRYRCEPITAVRGFLFNDEGVCLLLRHFTR